jgi:hypothetical protein
MDAHAPNVLVAGSNDYVDHQPCPQQTALESGSCVPPSRTNTGVSGVYFSFDAGHSWVQPTYTGWTRRDCAPTTPCAGHVRPIGTLPWYYENNLVSFGDPAVAVGPRPVGGRFSWANGSRVYYPNLVANFDAVLEAIAGGPFHGDLGVAVSRLDPTAARVTQKSNWQAPVIAIGRGGTSGGPDEVQVWADNAASSPFFGNVYVCVAPTSASAVYVDPDGTDGPRPAGPLRPGVLRVVAGDLGPGASAGPCPGAPAAARGAARRAAVGASRRRSGALIEPVRPRPAR